MSDSQPRPGPSSAPPEGAVGVSAEAGFKRPLSPSRCTSLVNAKRRFSPLNNRRRKFAMKKAKSIVLDEDEYVEKVGAIIERDFFPELEKLKARSDFIDAADAGDTAAMRRLRERFSDGAWTGPGGTNGKLRPETPLTFETPEEAVREERNAVGSDADSESGGGTPWSGKHGQRSKAGSIAGDSTSSEGKAAINLDKFLAKHTSEDNESFNEVMEETDAKFRRSHAWMFKAEDSESLAIKEAQLDLPSIESQAANGTSNVHKPLETWTYQDANAVFYVPDGVTESDEQKILGAKEKERSINFENTRFKSNPWKSDLQKNKLAETRVSQVEKNLGKVGADGKELEAKATPRVNGFALLKMMPSPAPSQLGESPLMTWGQVEDTPYRLEGAEDAIPMKAGSGPGFSIQSVPKRDRLAHELAEKNSKFYRDKKGKAVNQARSNVRTPKNKTGMTTRVATMSPAAQRLAANKLGIRLGTDKALRASYTPSPSHLKRTPSAGGRTRTPGSGVLGKSGGNKTPLLSSMTPGDVGSMTDGLLKLPGSSPTGGKKSGTPGGSRRHASNFL